MKSVSLVELKKQQWAKEKGMICTNSNSFIFKTFWFWLCLYDISRGCGLRTRRVLFYNHVFRRAGKIKRILEKSKYADCFQRSKVFYCSKCLCRGILLNISVSTIHRRDHVIYPEIRSNDCNDRLQGMNKDIQLPKNLSFPPISLDNQKQNVNNVRLCILLSFIKIWFGEIIC